MGPADADFAFATHKAEGAWLFSDNMAFAAAQFLDGEANCANIWGVTAAFLDQLSDEFAAQRANNLAFANLYCQYGSPEFLATLQPNHPDMLAFNAAGNAANVLLGQQMTDANDDFLAEKDILDATLAQDSQAANNQVIAAYALTTESFR